MFRNMLQRFAAAAQRFFYGRYGVDELNKFLLIAAVVLNVVSLILSWLGPVCAVIGGLLTLFSYVLWIWCLFRCLSRNLERRSLERRRYLVWKSRITDRRNRYYRCPNCKQTVRVPKGRGKICIKCPKCSEKFIRKS